MAERLETPGRWLAILGIGEDGVEGFSAAAAVLVRSAVLVVGGERHLALVEPLLNGPHPNPLPRAGEGANRSRMVWPRPIADAIPAILARRGEPVAVLASGDPFCYGIGSLLARAVPMAEILCIPARSAFSLAAARLGWALQDCATISFCGRPLAALAPLLQPGSRVLALSADAATPASLAGYLRERGFGPSRLHVLEALGGPRERIRSATADTFSIVDVHALNLVAIELSPGPGARVIPLSAGLADEAFEHDGQITKREIRAVTLAVLAPRRGEMLWDIGCGSGSVAIEWMLRSPANQAVAVERQPERAARAARNAVALGVPDLQVVVGSAPAALAGLPEPDAVFVGGGAQEAAVLEAAWAALRGGGRMVANAVTIETEAALFAACKRLGGTLTRLSVERLGALGARRGFRPARTVTQWSATKV
ncbi:MAG: precorrin-6y C5,15-methyltransferase (decarboxylating) subunit CbiE [Alphaproteobacteria bacterium]|nr:precorrin-6y C5,15-methyltransferase (decarboxylating) subunit CbiE [Alphaproteobacteria bacterium]